jgi:ABC-type glycerol-3-phosphate transport system substrate-binding protein
LHHLTVVAGAHVIPAIANREINPQYLRDLSPLMTGDPEFSRDDFLPNLIVADGDKIHTLPIQAGYQLIYYDQAAFDAAGLPYPTADWTLDEFLLLAEQLTVRDGDAVVRWGYVPASIRSNPLLEALLTAPVGMLSDPRHDDPDVIAALDWFGALLTEHAVMPRLNQFAEDAESAAAIVSSGRAAMWSDSSVVYANHAQSVDRLGVVNAPRTDDGIPAAPFIAGFGISTASPHPTGLDGGMTNFRGALRWIARCMTQSPGSVQRGQSRTVAGDAAFRNELGQKRACCGQLRRIPGQPP